MIQLHIIFILQLAHKSSAYFVTTIFGAKQNNFPLPKPLHDLLQLLLQLTRPLHGLLLSFAQPLRFCGVLRKLRPQGRYGKLRLTGVKC